MTDGTRARPRKETASEVLRKRTPLVIEMKDDALVSLDTILRRFIADPICAERWWNQLKSVEIRLID